MYSGDKKQGKMPNPPDCRSYYAGYNKGEFLIKLRKGNNAPPASSRPQPTIMAGIRGMSIYIGDPFSYPPIMQVRIKGKNPLLEKHLDGKH